MRNAWLRGLPHRDAPCMLWGPQGSQIGNSHSPYTTPVVAARSYSDVAIYLYMTRGAGSTMATHQLKRARQ